MLERVDGNPASALVGYIQPQTTEHMPASPREELTEFYRRLLQVDAEPQNRLRCYVFHAIPKSGAGKQKHGRFQPAAWASYPLIRLGNQELHQLTGKGQFMFPIPLSENTLGNILL